MTEHIIITYHIVGRRKRDAISCFHCSQNNNSQIEQQRESVKKNLFNYRICKERTRI